MHVWSAIDAAAAISPMASAFGMTSTDLLLAIVTGLGATALLDAWNVVLRRAFGIASLDYCVLGRLVVHLTRSHTLPPAIANAPRTRVDCPLGWFAHYAIGAGLAVAFVLGVPGWLHAPTLPVALAYGIATVVLPFFVLQPALGLGVASSAARSPAAARTKSLATHTIYGLGLYASAWLVATLMR